MIAGTRAATIRSQAPVAGMCAIAAGLVVSVAVGRRAGAVCLAVVLLALVNAYLFSSARSVSRAFLLLALVPVLGLAALALPSNEIVPVARDALAAGLLLAALVLARRLMPLEAGLLRLRRRDLPWQLLIAAVAIPLGIAGQQILGPHPLAHRGHVLAIVLAVVVLVVLAAPSLELLFRWALQLEMLDLYGDAGLLPLNALFAALYVGTRSPGYVALMCAFGIGLSLAVRRTGTVWGAVAAHGILDAGVLVIWPLVLR